MPYSPLQLAEAFIRTGELNDALDALNQHLASLPDDDEARRLRASVLRRTDNDGHLQAALDDLNALENPTAEDIVQRSIILQALDDWPGANAAMEQAHDLKPDDDRITERYLLTLEKSGSPDQAYALVQTLPKSWRWLQIAGELAQRLGDQEAALQSYDAALADLEKKLDTENSAFAANLKQVLLLKRDSAKTDA